MKKDTIHKMHSQRMVPLLLSMAFPPMISMLVQSLYNVVDSIYVARISENALTAVSLAFPLQILIISVAVGLGVGVNSFLSRCFGAKKLQEANIGFQHGICFAFVASIIFAFFAFFFSSIFLRCFTNDLILLQQSNIYLQIILYGSFSIIFYILFEKVFQASGNMLIPMIIQLIGAILNIILDPILIFGFYFIPALGVKGAAIATVFSQFLSMCISIIMFYKIKPGIQLSIKTFHFQKSIAKDILKVAFPSMMMNALSSIIVMWLNILLIRFSNLAVAFYGVYYKLQTFVYMPIFGLVQGAMPILGFNYGANNKKRLFECLKVSLYVSAIIIGIGWSIFMFFPTQLLGLFDQSKAMLEIGVVGLRILSFSFIPAIFGCILSTFFQAIGSGMQSLLICLLRQCVITIPCSYLFSKLWGLNGIWFSFVFAETIAAFIATCFYFKFKYKHI